MFSYLYMFLLFCSFTFFCMNFCLCTAYIYIYTCIYIHFYMYMCVAYIFMYMISFIALLVWFLEENIYLISGHNFLPVTDCDVRRRTTSAPPRGSLPDPYALMARKFGDGGPYSCSTNIILPSGKQTVCYWKWPFIVDLPINSMVIFHNFVYVYQRVDDLSGSRVS